MKWYENWIQVFKIGAHTDSAGNSRMWTQEDLDTIVNNYNPSEQEAPVVLGHPKTDEPAYAWVCELRSEGGILFAKLDKVDPEFSLWVEKGLYRKISIALDAELNLRHVGFLGAANPAVKGLCNDFSSGGDVCVFFTDVVCPALKENGFHKLSGFFKDKKTFNFKENTMFKKPSTQEFSAKIEELERELQFAQKSQARQEFGAFLGTLHSEAKITAEDKIHLAQVFEALSDVDAACFAQESGHVLLNAREASQESSAIFHPQGVRNDGVELLTTSVSAFSAFLEALPSRVELKELATRENAPKGTYRTPQEELGMKIAKSIQK